MSPDCTEKACEVAAAMAVVATGALGVNVATGIVELIAGGGKLATTIHAESRKEFDGVMRRVRRDVEKNHVAWLERDVGPDADATRADVEAAFDAFGRMGHRCLPSPETLVADNFALEPVVGGMLAKAVEIEPVFAESPLARQVFVTIVGQTYLLVRSQDAFIRDVRIITYGELLRLAKETNENVRKLIDEGERIKRAYHLTDAALDHFFEIIGEKRLQPEKLILILNTIATRYQDLRTRQAEVAASSNEAPDIEALERRADEALELGDLDKADKLLAEAEAKADAAIAKREAFAAEEAAAIRAEKERAANRLARRADIALTNLAIADASRLYAAAADRLDSSDNIGRWNYQARRANALLEHGRIFPGLDILAEAIAVLRDDALPLVAKDQHPAEWATTQNNLAIADATLGQRAEGQDALHYFKHAVEAFKAALTVRTREAMPAQWAMTQNNLAVAYDNLGHRAEGQDALDHLRNAVAAYEAALTVRTREAMPYLFAQTNENLGLALTTKAHVTGDVSDVESAIRYFDRALEVYRKGGAEYDVGTCEAARGRAAALLQQLGG